jgi:hypothetical protein
MYIIAKDNVPFIAEPDWYSAIEVAQQCARSMVASRQILFPMESFVISCEELENKHRSSKDGDMRIMVRRRSTSIFHSFWRDNIEAIFSIHSVRASPKDYGY